MDIELLYFNGCPSWLLTEQRLREAIEEAGLDAVPVRVSVTTAEEAERLRFRGSPTVLLDGRDPFADESAPFGLACRVFPTPDGLQGAPTVAQLVEALQGGGRP